MQHECNTRQGRRAMKNAIILFLAVALIFTCDRLVRVENQRYALSVGMCPSRLPGLGPVDLECIRTTRAIRRRLTGVCYTQNGRAS
jgi:hypothetical protein